AIAVQRGVQLIQFKIQAARNQRQIGVDILVLLANQKTGYGRVVVDNDAVFSVEELAARGQDRFLADAILLGQHAVVGYVQHLQAPQAGNQRQHQEKNAVLYHRQLERGYFLAAIAA